MGSIRDFNGQLHMRQHLRHIHFTPLALRLRGQGIDTVDDLLFDGGIEEVFDFHNGRIWGRRSGKTDEFDSKKGSNGLLVVA